MWVHTKFCANSINLRTSYLLCLELCDICFSRITRHQAWDDEIKGYGSPQSYQVEARTSEEIAHSLTPLNRILYPCTSQECGRCRDIFREERTQTRRQASDEV